MITTHVLDLASGRPATSVAVVLEQASDAGWRELASARTDADGRVGDLGAAPAPGRFRLRFDTAGYLGDDAFFPEVTLQFAVERPEEHLHVPLLLSPFGYSTYRGSWWMDFRLGANSYGKAEVRVVKVTRGPERHLLRDLTAHITLSGDFEAVHVAGDNTGLPATDTMRNVVYAYAAEHPLNSLPDFAAALASHFIGLGPVRAASVRLREHPWERLDAHAWQRAAGGTRVQVVEADAAGVRHAGGIDDLLVLRASGSGFSGFDRDRYTTLPETEDRIMATIVTADWDHAGVPAEDAWALTRDTLLRAFTDHHSPSVQFTLHRMGTAALEADPGLERIHLTLPNRHHLPYDVSRFGIEDRGEVFHATSEPFGLIEATVERTWRLPAISGEAGRWAEWVAQIRTVTTITGPYQLQEDGHASYWGQLAMRNCPRLAYNGGTVRDGRCVRVANGLNSSGEPQMGLG